ncbi:MAG: HEAT repeat domain-containing protein [Planctomycetes bacterium]|nr:HEAT repeat domain-containing protein [Planctomycetota bacterium]
MLRRRAPFDLLLLLSLAACGGSPEPAAPDRSLEAQFQKDRTQRQETLLRQEDWQNVLMNLDKSLDRYATALLSAGNDRADRMVVSLETYLAQETKKHFADLVREADRDEFPGNRAIAAAALGFSQKPEALDPILNCLNDRDEAVVNNALLALGALRDPRTPVARLAEFVEDEKRPVKLRATASWTLMRLQLFVHQPDQVPPVWMRVLQRPVEATDPSILVHALRGLGLFRRKEYAAHIRPYLAHPTPLIRTAAALATGFCGDQASHKDLLVLLKASETNPNVRLTARKALQALAGGVDRGYDVEAWRQVFARGY